MLPLLLNKIIQTDKLLFLHLVTQKNRIYTLHLSQPRILPHSFRKQIPI